MSYNMGDFIIVDLGFQGQIGSATGHEEMRAEWFHSGGAASGLPILYIWRLWIGGR